METTCKQGKLIISDRSVQVIKPVGGVVWNVMRSAVVGVTIDNKMLGATVIFQTAAGQFKVEAVTRAKAQEIVQMFS